MTNQTNETIFQYRDIVKKLYTTSFILLVFSELIVIRLNIFKILEGTLIQGVIQLVLASTFILTLLFRLYFFIRPRVFSLYELHEDKLIVKFKKKEKEIHFDQIKEIKFSLLPVRIFGGYIVKLKSGQSFYFSSLLIGGSQIIKNIFNKSPTLLDSDRLDKYVVSLNLVDYSWSRARQKVFSKSFLIKLFVIPLALAFVFWFEMNRNIPEPLSYYHWFLIHFIINLMVLIAFNIIEESWVGNTISKNSIDVKAIVDSKNKPISVVERICLAGYGLTISAIGLLVFAF